MDYEKTLQKLRENRIIMDTTLTDKTTDYLFSKVAEIQNAKNVAVDILIDAMRHHAALETNLKNLEAEYEMERQSLMANDNEVKTQKSADLRESVANIKLADLVLKIHHAKVETLSANGFKSIVERYYENIRSLGASVDQQILVVKLRNEQTK